MKRPVFILLLFFSLRSNAQWLNSSNGKCPGYMALIDSGSSLTTLIQRLQGDWEFDELDKVYWIGYAREMYSIAARKDSAIQPLLTFIDTSKNDRAICGAIYTLHLIGINSTIGGRYKEDFINIKARNALLSLLKIADYQPLIIKLLTRDPKTTDIPAVFEAISANRTDCWALNNYLTSFSLDLPINQKIPADLGETLEFTYLPAVGKDMARDILREIYLCGFDRIHVANELLDQDLLPSITFDLSDYHQNNQVGIYVRSFLEKVSKTSYTNVGTAVQYYVENDHVYICTQATAKQRLVDWWLCLTLQERRKVCEMGM